MKFTSNLGEALHTALRKCCDSAPTSAAYNIVCELEEPWSEFVEYVNEEFKGFKLDRKSEDSKDVQMAMHLKKVAAHWSPYGKGRLAVALHCVFETFSDNDWVGFASFLDTVIVKKTPKAKAAAA